MKIITIALVLFARSTFVAAAPIEETITTTTTEPEPQDGPNGWSFCGVSLVLISLILILEANAVYRNIMELHAKWLVLTCKSKTYRKKKKGPKLLVILMISLVPAATVLYVKTKNIY